jgi:4-hydroxy-tetrahydrodipicolinate synthase|tara:strand:- start:5403 stop:6269 length:867 start_codon:yes stop_codon:yes gene_type:complete
MDLTGTGVALVTPFNKDKNIDFTSLGRIIDHCIEGGVNYLVCLGTTGETVTLTLKEKQELLDFTKNQTAGRVPLVAGFGGNDTMRISEQINSFNLDGYSAILSSSPNYNKPSQEGIFQHYKHIALNSPLPVILYNVPSRTGQNMEAETTIRLANKFEQIIGIKEAANDILQSMEIRRKSPSTFQLIAGDDIHALPMISYGCTGVISVVAQAIPASFTEMINAALVADFGKASSLQFSFLDLIKLIFEENNPAGIKAALSKQNLCSEDLRLPLVPISEDLRTRIQSYFD